MNSSDCQEQKSLRAALYVDGFNLYHPIDISGEEVFAVDAQLHASSSALTRTAAILMSMRARFSIPLRGLIW